MVSYGTEGQVLPALASGWTIADKDSGQEYVFTIRDGVTFHDGAVWDCSVAKLNFDHVLAGALRTPGVLYTYKLFVILVRISFIGSSISLTLLFCDINHTVLTLFNTYKTGMVGMVSWIRLIPGTATTMINLSSRQRISIIPSFKSCPSSALFVSRTSMLVFVSRCCILFNST